MKSEWKDAYLEGTRVAARGATRCAGRLTGASHMCGLDGCRGLRLAVRWSGTKTRAGRCKVTYPCTRGMEWNGKNWRIL